MYAHDFTKYQVNRFDSFCKILIRNESIDNRRRRKRRDERFTSFDELQSGLLEIEKKEDTYVTYSRIYKVKGIDITITDKRIADAVQYIMPNQRAVLLLSFFEEYSDMDIARLLGISHKTVAYRKKIAMQKLRALLEGEKNVCQEN